MKNLKRDPDFDCRKKGWFKEPCKKCNFKTPAALLNHLIQKGTNGCDAHRVIEVFLKKLYGSIHGETLGHSALYDSKNEKS